MSSLDFWSWASIGVLTVGSLGVFVWFLRDIVRMTRRERGEGRNPDPR